jgi:hypothetical protein
MYAWLQIGTASLSQASSELSSIGAYLLLHESCTKSPPPVRRSAVLCIDGCKAVPAGGEWRSLLRA